MDGNVRVMRGTLTLHYNHWRDPLKRTLVKTQEQESWNYWFYMGHSISKGQMHAL